MRTLLALLCALAVVSASAAEPHGPVLSGTVTDPEGRPVAARLWVVVEGTPGPEVDHVPPHDTEAGTDGSFAIELPRGRGATLYSCAEGFLPAQVRVEHPGEPVWLTVQPAAAIRGVVLRPDGSPQAGAWVWASQRGVRPPGCVVFWHPCPVTPTVTTDAEGTFEVAPLPPGWYNLFADAPGFVSGSAERVRAGAREAAHVTMPLRTGTAVSGRVVAPDGRPVAGARITAYKGRGAPKAVTGEDGSYRLEGVDQGEIRIVAEIDGEQLAEQVLSVGEDEMWAPDLVLIRAEGDGR